MAVFGLANYSKSTSRPVVVDPYGGQSRGAARRFQSQFAAPSAKAFGWGYDPESQFGTRLASRAEAGNPFAQYLQNTQGLFAPLQADAARAGREVATRAPGMFDAYLGQANDFLTNLLPGLQKGVNLEGAADASQIARQLLDQARSSVQSNALYQNALRQSTNAAQAGAAGRGLIDAGAQQGAEQDLARDLAAQFGQQQFGNQQAALGSYGQALGGQREAAQVGANLGQLGIQTRSDMLQALPFFAQLLQSGSQIPFAVAQQIQQFLAATQNPNLQLAQLTRPEVGQVQKSLSV